MCNELEPFDAFDLVGFDLFYGLFIEIFVWLLVDSWLIIYIYNIGVYIFVAEIGGNLRFQMLNDQI